MKNESSSEGGSSSAPDYSDGFHCTEHSCSLFSISVLIPMTTIFLILMVVGIIGNTITILIIRRNKDMKTTTNLYLSSMAVSDMIILLCLPFDLYRIWRFKPWIFGGFMCKFLNFISEGCSYSTILHVTALSIERYLAICFPLKAKVFITKKRVKIVIGFLWIFALVSAGPFYFLVRIEPVHNFTNSSATSWECTTPTSDLLTVMFWVTTAYFFFPVFCLNILYGFIGRKLWKSRDKIRGPNAANREKCHKQTVRILAVVVLAFVICWLPFHIGRIIFVNTDYEMINFSQYFNVVAMQLFYLSASINPILYNLISKKYRTAAYKLLRPSMSEEKASNVTRDEPGGNTDISVIIQHEYTTHV